MPDVAATIVALVIVTKRSTTPDCTAAQAAAGSGGAGNGRATPAAPAQGAASAIGASVRKCLVSSRLSPWRRRLVLWPA